MTKVRIIVVGYIALAVVCILGGIACWRYGLPYIGSATNHRLTEKYKPGNPTIQYTGQRVAMGALAVILIVGGVAVAVAAFTR